MGIEKARWCCLGLEGQWSNAGLRGIAVVVHSAGGASAFVLQHRAVDAGLENAVAGDPDVPISLVTDVLIRFCPWCGCELLRWYADVLENLATPGLAIGSIA